MPGGAVVHTLTGSRYKVMVIIQMCFLVVDLLINSFSSLFVFIPQYNIGLVLVYMVQDACIIFAFMALVLSFFYTCAFLVGRAKELFRQIMGTMFVIIGYLLLTIAWQYWSLSVRWYKPMVYNWPKGMSILWCIQRSVSPFYYYFYKRTMLMMSSHSSHNNEF